MIIFLMITGPLVWEGALTWVVVGAEVGQASNVPAECIAQGFCWRSLKCFPAFWQLARQEGSQRKHHRLLCAALSNGQMGL